MNIAIYARKSKVICQSESIENQISLCKEYCNKRFGDISISIYIDDGCSGKNIDRPEFQKMLTDISSKKINFIITYKLDRLCRNLKDFLNLIEFFDSNNVNFTSVKENFDLNSNTGKMMAIIYSMFSQVERESISERIRDNMYESAKTGRWLGGPAPLGYEFYKTKENNKTVCYLQIDSKSSILVECIYNKFLTYKSLTKVRNYAYTNGILGPRGNPLDLTTISNILRNPIYVKSSPEVVKFLKNKNINVFGKYDYIHGFLTYGKKSNLDINPIASISKHVGIIDGDSWLKVQSILDQNSKKFSRQGTGKTALLSGILKCSICGSNMRISYKKNKNSTKEHAYYICGKKKKLGSIACSCSNLTSTSVDTMVLNQVSNLDINKLIKIYEIYNLNNCTVNKNDLDIIEKNIKNRMYNIETLSNRLCLTNNELVLKNIINKMETLASEVDALNNRYHILNNKLNTICQSNIKNAIYDVNNFGLFLNRQPIELKREFINIFIDKIIWNSKTMEINILYKNH